MELENKTEKFYTSQGEEAVYDAERKLYTSLAAEERGHYLALVDYREYLIDPAGWFRKEEHHSLDGG
jgi:rubrerythrin